MIRKGSLFLLFILLATVNSFFILNYYMEYKVEKQQKEILSQIEEEGLQPDKHFSFSSAPLVLGAVTNEIKLVDGRTANLRNFFRKHNSPLYDSADFIVQTSDKYGFDYRLLPAIAMQESNLCRYIPADSHNCWGYGIYGNNVIKFSTYEEAIEVVARGIKTNYIDKGYTTPESIMSKYTPNSNGSWAYSINYFFKLLE